MRLTYVSSPANENLFQCSAFLFPDDFSSKSNSSNRAKYIFRYPYCSMPTPRSPIPKRQDTTSLCYRTSGAAAAANSLSIGVAAVSCGLPSNSRLHHMGGSNGLCPSCREGYTSQKKYHTSAHKVSSHVLHSSESLGRAYSVQPQPP